MVRRFSSGGGADEFLESGVTDGEEGGSEEVTVIGEAIAVGFGDFFDDAVGAEQTQLAADLGGEGAGVAAGSVAWMEQRTQIAIAEAGGSKLAASDDREQGEIGGIADAQRTEAASAVGHARRDLIEEDAEPCGIVDGTESVEVGVVGALRDLARGGEGLRSPYARVARRACDRESVRGGGRP